MPALEYDSPGEPLHVHEESSVQQGSQEAEQDKKKTVVSAAPFAAASHTNPAEAVVAGRRR